MRGTALPLGVGEVNGVPGASPGVFLQAHAVGAAMPTATQVRRGKV